MKSYIKLIKSISIFLTITILIPLYGCGHGLGGLLDKPVKIPVSPANVQATDGVYPDKVAVTWDPSSGASSYKVYRSDNNSTTYEEIAEVDSGLMYNDTKVTSSKPPTFYLYRVTAVNRGGDSGLDSFNTETDIGYSDPGVLLQTAPADVTATDGTGVGNNYNFLG